MSLTDYPHGVTSFGVPVLPANTQGVHTGNIFWVDSGTGLDSNDDASFDKPLATIDHAIGHCTANNGDVIYVKEGHAETLSKAGAITADMAGVTIIGLGDDADRPTLSFGTAVGADIDITAASVTFQNIIFKAALDNLTGPLHVAAAGCSFINCEFNDPTDIEANIWILTTAAADRLKLIGCFHNGYIAGNQTEVFIRLIGVNNATIDGCMFQGLYATGIIEMITTACKDIYVNNCRFNDNTPSTDLSKQVIVSGGLSGCTYLVTDCYDLPTGCRFYGGSGLTLEKDINATYASSASDMVIAASDLTYAASLLETYSSDLAAATATVTTAASDVVVVQSDVKVALSHIAVDMSHGKVIVSDTKAIASHLVVTQSNVIWLVSTQETVQSNVEWLVSNMETLTSDSIIDHSHLKVIVSDSKAIASHVVVTQSNVIWLVSTQETVQSDIKFHESEMETVKSNVEWLVSAIETVESDVIFIDSQLKTTASHLVVTQSNVIWLVSTQETVQSNVEWIVSNIETITSNVSVALSHIAMDHVTTDTIASHVVIVDTVVDSILSMLLVVHSSVEDIKSHIILLSH